MQEDRWMMLNWTYSREPKTFLYNGTVTQSLVVRKGDAVEEKVLETKSFQKVALEWMLEALSFMLRMSECPCKVTVFLPSRCDEQKERAWELDEGLVDLIKNNLPKAIEVWQPRHVTVHVKPFVPVLSQGEN